MSPRLGQTTDLTSLRALFDANGEHLETLAWINEQLKRRNDDAANTLQMQVAAALGRARRNFNSRTADSLDEVLAGSALKSADRRALHRYRVTDAQYERLKVSVSAQLRAGVRAGDRRAAACFVLFAAEWFRREHTGGQQKWENIAAALSAPLTYGDATWLTREGLGWWGRRVRHVNDKEERLLSLALEGGFPVRVLESQQGWLLSHLRRAVSRLNADHKDDPEAAVQAVQAVEHHIPQSFRGGEFQRLSAELISSVSTLRREAQHLEPRSLALSVRLDAARADWREDLPVRIEGEGARRLIDELVSTAVERLAGDARCRRLLLPTVEGGWAPGLELSLAGEIRLPGQLAGYGRRMRIAAAGALATELTGDLAVLEPPGDEGGWLARPRGAAVRIIHRFPFDAAAELEFRREEGPSEIAGWPHGEAERGELLVFAEPAEQVGPTALALVGAGSCRSRRPVLYAWAPEAFTATTLAGETLEPVWAGSGRALFRLERAARVGAPAADYAYRVEPAADGERVERLSISGDVARGLWDAEGRPIYAGAPTIRGREISGGLVNDRNLAWRRLGENGWRALGEAMEGPVEVVWRDPASRSLRDRAVLVVLPQGSRLTRRAGVDRSARLLLENADDWRVEGSDDPHVRWSTIEGGVAMAFVGAPERTVGLRLSHPDHGRFSGRAVFPTVEGGFAGVDNRILGREALLMLSGLRGARAFAPSRASLTVELHGKPSSRQMRPFLEELPLWSVSADVARVLSGTGDLDAEVDLIIDPGALRLRVRRYAGRVEFDRVARTVALHGVDGDLAALRTLEWRSLIDPSSVGLRQLGRRTWAEDVRGAPLRLPDDLKGPGLVYGRVHGIAVGRPVLVPGDVEVQDPLPPLRSASLVADHTARQAAIDGALDGLAFEPWAQEELRWMHAMLAALDGVPPSALDAFQRLWRKPAAALALLLSAETDLERERVWRLDHELPLIWALAPLSAWQATLAQRLRHFEALLLRAGLADASATSAALEQVRRECEALVALEPLLRAPLAAVRLCKPESITRSHAQTAQERIRRSTDVIDDQRSAAGPWPSCFYDDAAIRPHLPPLFQQRDRFHPAHWESLEAPCCAALHAAGRVTLREEQRARVRAAMAEDPLHFAEAYAAFVAEFAREDARAA